MLLDLGLLTVAYAVAALPVWHLTPVSFFASFIGMRIKVENLLLFGLFFYTWHVILSAFGLYGSRRLVSRRQEVVDLLKAVSVASILLASVAHIAQARMITREVTCIFWLTASVLLILCRLLLREYGAWAHKHGHDLRYVLIVGTNIRAQKVARHIAERPELGYRLIGFADQKWEGSQGSEKNECPVVTGLDHFAEFLREHVVDEVVITLPMKSFYCQAARIVADCQEQGVTVRALSSLFDPLHGRSHADELAMTQVYSPNQFEGWSLFFKRLLDMIGSSILLILLAPLFLVFGILVKLDSAGPAIFLQERVGLNKRKFRMYKLRTMVVNAEKLQTGLELLNEADGPVFKIKEDPRITRVGKYLRKASIDELPQLLNVLKGDMSLVGPRPLPLRDYQGFDQDWLRRRFCVRPGMTCLWQVNGRNSSSFGRWMELDIQYIDNWSLWLDLKILAKTVPAAFAGS